jgi:hypothetical protein
VLPTPFMAVRGVFLPVRGVLGVFGVVRVEAGV